VELSGAVCTFKTGFLKIRDQGQREGGSERIARVGEEGQEKQQVSLLRQCQEDGE